jgi:hypothetical protein
MGLAEFDGELVVIVLSGSSDVEELWEEILNQILQVEMTGRGNRICWPGTAVRRPQKTPYKRSGLRGFRDPGRS